MKQQRRPYQRRFERTLLSCALASCLVWATPAVLAQSTGATVRGQTAADARVTATNVATGFSRSVEAGDNGGYALPGLPPGTYRISIEAGGETTIRNITLRVGETVTLDPERVAQPAEGATGELDTIVVVGQQLIETKTSEIATYLSNRQIEALPQNSRNFLAFADIVPGVVFNVGNEGSSNLRSGAQLSNGINVLHRRRRQRTTSSRAASPARIPRGNPFPQNASPNTGHHLELQGRIRPVEQRRGDRGHPVGHQ